MFTTASPMDIDNNVTHMKSMSTDYTQSTSSHKPSSRAQPVNNVLSTQSVINNTQSNNQPVEFDGSTLPRGTDGQLDLQTILQSNETSYFPGLIRGQRYKLLETLQASLFGSVKVAYDQLNSVEVAIKISVKSLATHGRARSGAKVLENVKREANVMRYIQSLAAQQQQSPQDIVPNNNEQPVKNGKENVCALIEEIDDEYFHHLITEFVSGGDLHSLLLSLPNHRLAEPQAKYLFRQLARGVKYLHEHNVAHLDLSLENVCVSNTGKAKIIDFGVAVIHPLAPKSKDNKSKDKSQQSSAPQSPNGITDLDKSSQQQQQSAPPQSPSSASNLLLRTFLCSPISNPSQQPGKVGYMSPELYSGRSVWDAYSNDIFALGVILYCLLTGRPPFVYPHTQDPWFNFIASGHWVRLLEQAKKLNLTSTDGKPIDISQQTNISEAEKSQFQYVHIYSHLSIDALDIIDHILIPQHKRLSIDQILQHPWLQSSTQSQTNNNQ